MEELKKHTMNNITVMFITRNRNRQKKTISFSIVEEDHIIYIYKDMFKIYE